MNLGENIKNLRKERNVSQDILYTEISEGEELLKDAQFCVCWMLSEIGQMAKRIEADPAIASNEKERFTSLMHCLEEVDAQAWGVDKEIT